MIAPGYSRGRRALVLQQDESDCGAACLATLIRYYGGYVPIERIRELSGTDASGTTMLGLLDAATSLGMKAEGYEADLRSLATLDEPCLLHVVIGDHLQHFVVCFGTDQKHFIVGDPACGVLLMTGREVDEIWRSRALLLVRPSSSFRPKRQDRVVRRAWFRELLFQERRLLGIALLLGILVSLLSTAVALFSEFFLDEILPERDRTRLIAAIALVAVFLVAQNLFAAARQFILLRQARDLNIRIMSYFLDTIIRLPFNFFATRKVGDLVARMNDTQRLQRFITLVLGDVTISTLMLVAALLFIASYSGMIALWSGVGLLIIVAVGVSAHRHLVSAQRKAMNAFAVNESRYVDSIESIEAIKATGSEGLFADGMRSTYSRYQDAVFRLGKVGITFTLSVQSAGLLIVVGAIAWGASFVLADQMQPGEFVALLQMTNMLVPAAYTIVLSNVELQEAAVAFDRIYEFSSLDPEYETESVPAPIQEVNSLEMEGISFRFPGRPPLFERINLELERGHLVVLNGSNGEGKTTLLRILLRLYQPNSGTIKVNGRDWSSISTATWRRIVAIVPQRVDIFGSTVIENITMGELVRADRVVAFCRELRLHSFIESLPSGYATMLGRGGVDLSGGQRRLLGIARALYRKPQILLLDETTAALDSHALDSLANLILRSKSSTAILMISHHAYVQSLADKTYILQNGVLERVS